MPLFFKEEDSNLLPVLGVGALTAGALGSAPLGEYAGDYLSKKVEQLQKQRSQILDSKMRGQLVDTILDKNMRNIPVVIDPSLKGSAFIPVNKTFAPTRENAMKAVRSGGVMLAGGEKLPMSAFIERARDIGSYIGLAPGEQYIPVLAHELGHATSEMAGSSLRNSKVFRGLDMLGRRALHASPLVGAGAAIAALGVDSDNPLKWGIPATVLAALAPVLYEEHVASKLGLKGLKELNNRLIEVDAPAAVAPAAASAVGDAVKKEPQAAFMLRDLEDLDGIRGARVTKLKAPVEKPVAAAVEQAAEAAAKVKMPIISNETLDSAKKILRSSFGTYGTRAAGILAAPLLAMQARSLIDHIRDE